MKRLKLIIFALLVYIFLQFVARFPYFNVFIRQEAIHFILWICISFAWKIHEKVQFKLSLIMMLISLSAVLSDKPELAERLGVMAYAFMILGTVRLIRGIVQ